VRSPLMALSAAESLALLGLTLLMLWKVRGNLFRYCTQPDVVFCFVFAVVFAFAVGVSTFNFGTLSRYKIPAMPFFLLGISIAYGYWKRDRKLDVLASTE